MLFRRLSVVLLCASPLLAGCGDDEDNNTEPKSCSTTEQTGCSVGLVCEEVQGGEPACFSPLTVRGRVFDALDEVGIVGARVLARDPNGAVVSRVAITAEDGTYSLLVPARRDANGAPIGADVTLRADAAGYDTFPKAPRVALPIDTGSATGEPLAIESAATDIALIPLPSSAGLGVVSGTVIADDPGGTLVVAGGATGAADFDGAYTVFNVPAGDVAVRGYAAGLQLDEATATVTAGQETLGVDLHGTGDATAVVNGKVEIVNGGGSSETSVILVVKDTFNATVARGESPRGLRAFPVSGEFTIPDVPDGDYVILAAFENDGLVRDPDTSIGGTDIVEISVAGDSVEVADGFKVTGALAVRGPGADQLDEVSGTPTFVWEDDSSEGHYEVRLYDALGTLIWEDLAVPEVSGGDDVSVAYAGPALMPGMIYQFRAVSWSKGGTPTPISSTEDLKGVFIYR